MIEHTDFFASARRLEERGCSANNVGILVREILSGSSHYSDRDQIELFNIVLGLFESVNKPPQLLRELSSTLIDTIKSDHREGYCQDQMSKAQIVFDLSKLNLLQDADLIALLTD